MAINLFHIFVFLFRFITQILLLGLKYEELSWDLAKPSSTDDPDCLPCIFIQVNRKVFIFACSFFSSLVSWQLHWKRISKPIKWNRNKFSIKRIRAGGFFSLKAFSHKFRWGSSNSVYFHQMVEPSPSISIYFEHTICWFSNE